ncbi:MAG: glycosyltransferase family 39 protein [Candidatus Roizmanbacteria bacterium]|nr:glycosyltransferase family 39 protein [Candidatus Roizmanbacteria bacterium]
MHLVLRRIHHIPYLLLGLLPFLFITAVTFLELPSVWPDEAIFADTARTITLRGTMATHLFSDIIPGMQERALWYPPLYFYLLSWWTRFTAFDIVSIRLLSVLSSCLSLIMVYVFSLRITQQKWFGVLTMILLGIDYSFLRAGQVGRMDSLTLLWIITATYAGYEGRIGSSLMWLLIAGVASGLAVLTHPLGCIAPAVLAIYLLITKHSYRRLIIEYSVFFAPIAMAALGWYWWIGQDIAVFITQYQLQFARKANSPFFVVTSVQNYWSWRLLFLLYIGICVYAGTLRKQLRLMQLLTIGIVVAVIILMWGKEMWYTLYLQPWVVLFLIFVIHACAIRKLAYGMVAVYLILNLWLIRSPMIQYPSYAHLQSALAHTLPQNGTIYLSQIPDPYFIVRDQSPAVKLLEFLTVPVSDELYERLLAKSDYLIINQVFDERMRSYITRNMQTQTSLISSDGTPVGTMIKWVPRNKRK